MNDVDFSALMISQRDIRIAEQVSTPRDGFFWTVVNYSLDQFTKLNELLAYQLWQQAGEPSGRDVEFWLEAEKHLKGRPASVVFSYPCEFTV